MLIGQVVNMAVNNDDGSEKVDWHDYKAIEEEKQRQGERIDALYCLVQLFVFTNWLIDSETDHQLCVCVYAYVFVCVCACDVYVRLIVSICVHMCMCTCICMFVHVCVCVCVCVCVTLTECVFV